MIAYSKQETQTQSQGTINAVLLKSTSTWPVSALASEKANVTIDSIHLGLLNRAGQRAPGICLSPPPQQRSCKCVFLQTCCFSFLMAKGDPNVIDRGPGESLCTGLYNFLEP